MDYLHKSGDSQILGYFLLLTSFLAIRLTRSLTVVVVWTGVLARSWRSTDAEFKAGSLACYGSVACCQRTFRLLLWCGPLWMHRRWRMSVRPTCLSRTSVAHVCLFHTFRAVGGALSRAPPMCWGMGWLR